MISALAHVTTSVTLFGRRRRALVDSGCSQTIVLCSLVRSSASTKEILSIDGRRVLAGESKCKLEVHCCQLEVCCLTLPRLPAGIEVVIGMDVIEWLGGVTIGDKEVRFGKNAPMALASQTLLEIDDQDFSAFFDGSRRGSGRIPRPTR